jgi:tetratricopeptide (TPR) repeat protein
MNQQQMTNNIRLWAIGLIVVVLAVVGYYGYDAYSYNSKIVMETYPSLTVEEINELKGDVAAADAKLAQSDKATTNAYNEYLDKASALRKMGKLGEARGVLYEAKGIFPDNAGVYRDLYELQVEMNDLRGARKNVEKFVSLNPDSAARWDALIDFHYNSLHSDVDTLHELYKEGLSKTNSHVDLLAKYAMFQEEVGNTQAAIDLWIQAGGKDPEDKTLYDAEVKRLTEKLGK